MCCLLEFFAPLYFIDQAAVDVSRVLANAGLVEVVVAAGLKPVYLRGFSSCAHAHFTGLHFFEAKRAGFLLQCQVSLTVEMFPNLKLNQSLELEARPSYRLQQEHSHFNQVKYSIKPPHFHFLLRVSNFKGKPRKNEAREQVKYRQGNHLQTFPICIFLSRIEHSDNFICNNDSQAIP